MSAIAIPAPRKAEKKRVKLKMAIQGPSGSGKTWGALALVKNLWPDAKVCVIDTENESASLYADKFEFDTIPLAPPFHTERYEACIDACIANGYDVAIIDSITPQWDGDGGILRRKEELDQRPGSNSYTNWSKFTPEHTRFKEKIVQAPIHIIATMRSKQDYILETNDRGKSQPKKVGMAPIQRDGFDYEFSLVFDVQMDHKAQVDKNRTGLFDGRIINLADKSVAEELRAWLESGKVEFSLPKPVQSTTTEHKPVSAVETISGFVESAKKNGRAQLALMVGTVVVIVPADYPGFEELEKSEGKVIELTARFDAEIRGKKVYRFVDFVRFVDNNTPVADTGATDADLPF